MVIKILTQLFYYSIILLISLTPSLAQGDSAKQYRRLIINGHNIIDQSTLKTRSESITTDYGLVKLFFHFQKKDQIFLNKVVQVFKEDTKKIVEYFYYAPRESIHIFLKDGHTLANGSAAIFPRNLITLYLAPPTGQHYLVNRDDWIRGVIIHELTHVIQLDMTYGLTQNIRNFFGSIGKLWNNILPLWFIEGLAVWAETEFSLGGRGRRPLLNYEIHQKLLDDDFCQSIDCLDGPGQYPHRHSAYWLGWRFLHFLENKKEGTLRCLVQYHSRTLLNSLLNSLETIFRECAGQSSKDLFASFINTLKDKYLDNKNFLPKNLFEKVKLPFKGDGIIFQRGLIAKEGLIHYVSDDDGQNFINTYDLQSGNHQYFQIKQNIYSLLSAYEDRLFFSSLRNNPIINPRYLQSFHQGKVSDLTMRRGFDYFFQTRQGQFYFSYKNNRWFFYQLGKDFPLKIFEELEDIQSPFVFNDKIIFKSVLLQQESRHTLKELSLKTYDVNKIKSFNGPFSLKGRCDNFLFMASEGKDFIYDFNTLSTIKKEYSIAFMIQEKSSSLWFFEDDPLHAFRSKATCDTIASALSEGPSLQPIAFHHPSPPIIPLQDDTSYQATKYLFYPTHLLYFFAGRSYAISTTLSDPLDIHSIGISIRDNTGLDFETEISYLRDWEYFDALIGYEKSRSKQEYEYIENKQRRFFSIKKEKIFTDISKIFYLGKWDILLGMGPSFEITRDEFKKETQQLKDKNVIQYNVRGIFYYRSHLQDSFFRNYSFGLNLFKRDPQSQAKDYFGGTGRFSLLLRPLVRWRLLLEKNYSRYWGNSTSQFLITGPSDSTHTMYAINRALGNQVTTARGTLRWDAINIYRGYNLLPIKLNEIDLYGGLEYLKTNYISLSSDQVLHDDSINAFFLGLSFQTNILYRLPLDFDFVYSRLIDDNKYDSSRLRLFIHSSLGF